tara:strand:- start:709 stop:1203 length:495 start_codon:yes stop_codon:yes gene_type:complete
MGQPKRKMTPEQILNPTEGMEKATEHWFFTKDGNDYARSLFHRHYSYRPYKDGRKPKLFCGPGFKTVLVMEGGLFVWRKFNSGDNQQGINCSIFRNETPTRSSDLILEAEQVALDRWGATRLYTYVAPLKVKSDNPGYCFKKAGWKPCGITKVNKLLILDKHIK